jgi:glycosyltransferase involved in cell wall biosynthesis
LNSRVCVVSQRYYPGDARMATEIHALQEAGYAVDVVVMQKSGQRRSEVVDGVQIYRVPSMERQRAGKLRYVLGYAAFFVPVFFLLIYLQITRRYRLIHITNLPDALVFTALLPRFLGAKVMFDIRECTAEMFLDRFGFDMQSRAMKLMVWLEQASLNLADATVTCTEQMKQAVVKRGADAAKISVMLNVPDAKVFKDPVLPDVNAATDQLFKIITHGTIIRRYGHEVLLKAMPYVVAQVPSARLEVLGRGQLQPELERMVSELGLEGIVTFGGFVPDDELMRRLRAAHVGVVPLLRTVESDLVHTYKMFEYIALGLPVVISRTTAAAAYFDDDSMQFCEAGDERDLARAIIALYRDPERRCAIAKHALKRYEQYAPATQRAAYLEVVQRLLKDEPAPALQTSA